MGPTTPPRSSARETLKTRRDDEEDDLRLEFGITSEYHAGNNADFRPLDESSEEVAARQRRPYRLGYTSLSAMSSTTWSTTSTVGVGAIHSGLWGSDQIGSVNAFMNFLYFYKLNASGTSSTSRPKLSTTIGRQSFEIGGADDDFFLKDILDAVTIRPRVPSRSASCASSRWTSSPVAVRT